MKEIGETGNDLIIHIRDDCISNRPYEKILGVYFDNKLNFSSHVSK